MSRTAQLLTRTYGMKFRGFMSALKKHLVPLGYLTADSRDFLFDPFEGKWVMRNGSSNIGGTSGIIEVGGVDHRARHMLELALPDMTDGYPTHGVLFAADPDGCLYFYSSADAGAAVNRVLAKDSNYPADLKMPHMVQVLGGSVRWYHGATSASERDRICGGSYDALDVGDRIYFPNFFSQPSNWNKRFNSTAITGKNERIFPTGHISPLGPPTVATPTKSTDGVGTWPGQGYFYISQIFGRDDGSWSKPFVPRASNDNLPSGLGLIGPLGGTGMVEGEVAKSITISGIATPPDGYTRSALLRTPITVGSAPVNPEDLRLWEIIDNPTQTTFVSYKGDDSELVDDPLVVRLGGDAARAITHPFGAKFMAGFDGRICIGFLRRNLACIQLAPWADNTGTRINGNDDTLPALVYDFWVDTNSSNLKLRYNGGTSTDISLASPRTVEDIVDLINATTSASTSHQWAAQLVPGTDPKAPATSLFGSTGSDYRRCFNNAYPGLLFLDASYYGKQPRYKSAIQFTEASPNQAPYAAHAYVAGNLRFLPPECGVVMGIEGLLDGAVVPGSRAAGILRNNKGGRSGDDIDYRLDKMLGSSACISPYSVVQGNGWIGYMTPLGYAVNDGGREVIITTAIWNPETQQGEFAYEIAQCLAYTGKIEVADPITNPSPSEAAHFHAFVDPRGRLSLTYRASSAVTRPNRMVTYDFSLGIENEGLAQVLDSDGQPFGWSTPQTLNVSEMVVIKKSDGHRTYAVLETVSGVSAERVDQIDTGRQDNGAAITSAKAYCSADMCGSLRNKSQQAARVFYKKNGAGLSAYLSTDKDRSTKTLVSALTTSGTSDFSRAVLEPVQTLRGPAELLEWSIEDDGTNSAPELLGIESEVEVLDDFT